MNMVFKQLPRSVKWIGIFLLGFIVVLASGRLIQKALDSHFVGERPPYLQMLAADAITLRWQSEKEYPGLVRYGLDPQKLDKHFQESDAKSEHEIRLSGLNANTRYYYSIGDQHTAYYKGSDFWFVTAPKPGDSVPVRFWVLGDPGYPGKVQNDVRDSMLDWLQKHTRKNKAYIDLLMTTGDNAYRSGSNSQFQDGFFMPYKNILRNAAVWPAYGNHDARRWVFFDLFTFPTQAESGGVASGTEHYYSFDYANLHIVVLDTPASDLDDDSEMLRWLKKDLKATQQQWLISLLHHPPYTKGTHNSDKQSDSGGRMFDVRENVLPILEQAGVDLVLSGHSHMYQRSPLINCHYGKSTSLKQSMLRDTNDKSVYRKHSVGLAPYQGTVYAVVGSSSKVDQGPLNHPALPYSLHETGSLLVDVEADTLTARFINAKGNVSDRFSIIKGTQQGVTTRFCVD